MALGADPKITPWSHRQRGPSCFARQRRTARPCESNVDQKEHHTVPSDSSHHVRAALYLALAAIVCLPFEHDLLKAMSSGVYFLLAVTYLPWQ